MSNRCSPVFGISMFILLFHCWCMKRAEFKQVLVHLYIFLQNVSAYAQEGQIFAKILKEVSLYTWNKVFPEFDRKEMATPTVKW